MERFLGRPDVSGPPRNDSGRRVVPNEVRNLSCIASEKTGHFQSVKPFTRHHTSFRGHGPWVGEARHPSGFSLLRVERATGTQEEGPSREGRPFSYGSAAVRRTGGLNGWKWRFA